jgi:PhzF family phenazine biosynthesis protein
MKLYQVDSFTNSLYSGNPAGVAILKSSISEKEMLNIASEMNCSETAFLIKENDHYRIRYFTPETEVPLCGHATLASAHILFNYVETENASILLKAKEENIIVYNENNWIKMKFPVDILTPSLDNKLIIQSLRIKNSPLSIQISRFGWYLAEFEDEKEIQTLSPDFSFMREKKLP